MSKCNILRRQTHSCTGHNEEKHGQGLEFIVERNEKADDGFNKALICDKAALEADALG